MVNWKNVLGTSVLSAGLVFSSFAPLAFAESTKAVPAKVKVSEGASGVEAKLPFLSQHNGSTFDVGLVNEDKVLQLLIKQGIVSKNASKDYQQKQLQAYVAKRSQKAEQTAVTQQDVKQVRTELQETAGLELKDAGVPKADNAVSKKASKRSTSVDPIVEEGWDGLERKDEVLVLLIDYPDRPHNQVKEDEGPVLMYDDYSQTHYEDMIFGDNGYTGPDGQNLISMKQFYEEQSGGSYTVEGKVSKWYTAEHPAAYYGGNDPVGGNDSNPRDLIKEALNHAAKDMNLNEFDIEDQFDLDGDGNYREPDGIIDHLMVVHSGIGEEAGGGSLGEDAIWSHSSSLNPYKIPGTSTDVPYFGGSLIGYGYTVQPEDGAAGVFAHEFGHNLGLPDEYDTMYTHNSVGAPTGYWTIMSSGSWAGKIGGTEPTGFSPYDKEFLQDTMPGSNWFKDVEYNLEDLAGGKYIKLDEASVKGTNADAVKINLPNKTTVINTPASGQYEYFSGSADQLDNAMTASVDLTGKTAAQLTFKTWYSIEEGYDYAYVEVSDDNGAHFTPIEGNITTTVDPYKANLGNGITGDSKGWVDATFDLSAYAGKNVQLNFHYVSDAGVSLPGFYVDDIQVTADGQPVLTDNADGSSSSFELGGFTKNNGIKLSTQYYLVEWRNYAAADKALENISRGNSLLSYDPGMVVWYVDNKYTDNWVGDHPGDGFLGVVDAHQEPATWRDSDPNDGVDGYGVAQSQYQIKDAAFSLNKTGDLYLDYKDLLGRYLQLGSQPKATVFDDSRNYSNPGQIYAGRNVPNYGVKIHVVGQAKDMSVGAIEIHKGNEETLTLDSLATNVYSNQEGHNKVTVTGTAHNDGAGESLAVTYELVNSAGEVLKTKTDELKGLYQTFKKSFTLPKDTPTGDYTVKVTATNNSGQESTNLVSFKVDNDAPTVVVDKEGNSASAKEAAVKVTLNDADPSTLEYVWAKDEKAPAAGWKTFANGDVLKLQGENGTWYLHVRAKDFVGNELSWTSKAFALDNTAPVLKLKGDNPLQVEQGKEFKDPGFTATDDVDGDLAGAVKVTSSVDVNKVGQYTITYTVTDKAGNEASVTRTVKLVAKAPSTTGNTGNNNGSSNGNSGSTQNGNLPITATSMFNLVVAGFLTLAIGLTTLVVQRRRKKLV
ncbi:immune inhibitor A domain-containing protein [Neobacillus drentensis]|uniref:immune inhibitor A domain-containing protein n=1 Tax=Neobacillus drentensis TaxID=220684 RepID=UPI002FFECA8A